MNNKIAFVIGGLSLLLATRNVQAQIFESVQQSSQDEEFIIDFNDSVSLSTINDISFQYGVTLRANSARMVSEDKIYVFHASHEVGQRIIRQLQTNRNVQAADQNQVMHAFFTPNDPQYPEQWGLHRIGIERAWNTTCGRGIRVAVIDTGVACENYDGFSQLSDFKGTNCIAGWDFVNDDEHANDDHGHGSHVAGTIAQTTNNGIGVAGIAYCSTIIPVKVLDYRGSGTTADVAEGIRFAADAGAHIINLSLGGGPRNRVMAEAINYARSKGTVVICAAGNNGHYVESPANEDGTFAVSAIEAGDLIASFSSRGPEIDIAAPGVNILQQTICDHGRGGCEQFIAWSGTSMATPHVAGITALIMSQGVTNVDAVENILRNSAQIPKHGDLNPQLYGAGIVSAESALSLIKTRQVLYRGFSTMLLFVLIASWINKKGGKLEPTKKWLLPAIIGSVGLFFLPMILPESIPGIEIISRPPGDLTLFTNEFIHQFLPLGSAFLPIILISMFYNRKYLRPMVGGFSLGTAGFLMGTFLSGMHAAPFGWFAMFVWTLGNIIVMGTIARLMLDTSKNQS
jgi:serine protease